MDAIQSKVEVEELEVRAAAEFWDSIDDIDRRGAFALKISVPPVRMPAIVTEILDREFAGRAAADAVSGVIRLALEDPREDERAADVIAELRRKAQSVSGTLVVERATANVKKLVDCWGEVGRTLDLMREIKMRFDPRCLLNPGRFVGGI